MVSRRDLDGVPVLSGAYWCIHPGLIARSDPSNETGQVTQLSATNPVTSSINYARNYNMV